MQKLRCIIIQIYDNLWKIWIPTNLEIELCKNWEIEGKCHFGETVTLFNFWSLYSAHSLMGFHNFRVRLICLLSTKPNSVNDSLKRCIAHMDFDVSLFTMNWKIHSLSQNSWRIHKKKSFHSILKFWLIILEQPLRLIFNLESRTASRAWFTTLTHSRLKDYDAFR